MDRHFLHDVLERRLARVTQEPRHRHAALQAEGRIDDIDLEECLRQIFVTYCPHVIDRLADIPEDRRRHEGALHEATSGFLIER